MHTILMYTALKLSTVFNFNKDVNMKHTKSLISFLRDECIPMIKGVGVLRNSMRDEGNNGMYT